MKQLGGFGTRPPLAGNLVLRRVFMRVALVLLLAQVGAAQEATWQGEITLTMSTETFEHGVRESRRVEERWTDFVARRDDRHSVSFDAAWTVVESRSSSSEDCNSIGHAAGTGPYPWFIFELDPFEEVHYVLYSGGTGGDGPSARGTDTRTCRYRDPATFTYGVTASWLQAAPFPMHESLLDTLSQEELATMPQATLDMLRELDATHRELANVTPFAVTGRIDPEQPQAIRGSAMVEVEGGTVVLAWDLVRPLVCADTSQTEHLAREAEVVHDTQASDQEAIDLPEAPYSGTPLAAADVADALLRAIGADRVALKAPVESGEAGGIQSFAVRVGDAGDPLPTLEHVLAMLEVTCVEEGSLEGARRLIVGSVQWVVHRFRITVRVVDVETGAILDALRVDGAGGSDDLSTAIASAFARAVAR